MAHIKQYYGRTGSLAPALPIQLQICYIYIYIFVYEYKSCFECPFWTAVNMHLLTS